MVECECSCYRSKTWVFKRFNRYMVECECGRTGGKGWSRCVLIDTWWNVNTERPDINIFHAVVLIDTWWNVNDEYLIAHTNIISFNRYMVECESVVFASMTTTVDSFNRYMVECECA